MFSYRKDMWLGISHKSNPSVCKEKNFGPQPMFEVYNVKKRLVIVSRNMIEN